MCEAITKPEHDFDGDVHCPKCGELLWFYRIYSEPLVEDKDILDISCSEWDEEYVICRRCKYIPAHEWWEEQVILA